METKLLKIETKLFENKKTICHNTSKNFQYIIYAFVT